LAPAKARLPIISTQETLMSEVELLEKLADAINRLTKPATLLSIDLWDIATISQYLKREPQVVQERIAVVPSFPRPIRLPAKKGLAHPLYKAAEIIAWAESLQERKTKQ
jgi:hypothetical protein